MDSESVLIHNNGSQTKKRRGRPLGSTIKNSLVLTSSTLFDTSRHVSTCQDLANHSIGNKPIRRTRRQRSDDYIRRKFLYEEASESYLTQNDGSKKGKKRRYVLGDGKCQKSRRGRPPKNYDNQGSRLISADLFNQDEIDGLLRQNMFDFCFTSPLKMSSKRPVDFTDLDILSDFGPVKLKRKSKMNNELLEMTDDIVSDYLTDCNLDELGIASDELPDLDFPEGQDDFPNVNGLDGLVAVESYLYENGNSPDFLIDPSHAPSSHQNPISVTLAPTNSQTVPQRRRKSPLRPLDSLDYHLPYLTPASSESYSLHSLEYSQLLSNQNNQHSLNPKSLDTPLHDLDLPVDFSQIPFALDNNFSTGCVDNFAGDVSIGTNNFMSKITVGGISHRKSAKRRSRKSKEDNVAKLSQQQPAPAPIKPNKRPVTFHHRPSILRSAVNKSTMHSNSVAKDVPSQNADSFSSLTKNMTKYTNNHPEKASDLIFQRLNPGHSQEPSQKSAKTCSNLLQSQTASSVLLQKKQMVKPQSSEPHLQNDQIPTSHGRPARTKTVKSIEIQKPGEELVSGYHRVVPDSCYDDVEYDVYRIPAKGYSSNQCFVDYEPQIKERREKVITQDMIDQRPRQAIRKYYNSLKKHLAKPDLSVNSRSFWSQNSIDSRKTQPRQPVSGQSEIKYVDGKSANLHSTSDSSSRHPHKNYKVVVVDDPSGYREAVLVSHPPFDAAPNSVGQAMPVKSSGSKFLHNSVLTTNTAVRSIRGRSRRSLLKEFRAGVENQLRNAALRPQSYTKSVSCVAEDDDPRQVDIQISDSSITEDE